MKNTKSIILLVSAAVVSAAVIVMGIAAGSVFIPPGQILRIFGNKLFGVDIGDIPVSSENIILSIRSPRVILAFLT